jgi:hypothetical protein
MTDFRRIAFCVYDIVKLWLEKLSFLTKGER